jgi:hypothetical protein
MPRAAKTTGREAGADGIGADTPGAAGGAAGDWVAAGRCGTGVGREAGAGNGIAEAGGTPAGGVAIVGLAAAGVGGTGLGETIADGAKVGAGVGAALDVGIGARAAGDTDVVVGANSSSIGAPAPTMMTPPQTEHRARTPPDGTFAGSTRNTELHSGHETFT